MQRGYAYEDRSLVALTASVTRERLQRYVVIAGGDTAQALRPYMWNTALSEALYGSLQGLEVTLRNKFHAQLSTRCGASWYENGAVVLRYAQQDQVTRAKDQLRQQGKPLDPSRVIAELSFGFWVGLLSSKYENALWRPHLRGVFAHAPSAFLRKDAHRVLDDIRFLRNRIAHHEPVLQRNLLAEHGEIITAIGWLCPVTAGWVAHHSRFAEVHAARP